MADQILGFTFIILKCHHLGKPAQGPRLLPGSAAPRRSPALQLPGGAPAAAPLCVWVAQSGLTPCDPVVCPWNSLGKNTGVGGHSLLQGIFLTQELNPHLLHCRQILCRLSYKGSPAAPHGCPHLSPPTQEMVTGPRLRRQVWQSQNTSEPGSGSATSSRQQVELRGP